MDWKTLDAMNLDGKVVLTRVDINVPMSGGRVTDTTRIDRIKPTVDAILATGGKPVLMAHFGRPKGAPVAEMSLRHLVPTLEDRLATGIDFAEDCIGLPAKKVVAALAPGRVGLLENTRFHAEEEANDSRFSAALAALGEVYCNDAFSAAHRAHASTEGVARLLPSCVGRLMEAELSALEAALENPKRPVVAVVGGAKVSTKLDLLGNLVEKVDTLIVGGGMANTFIFARGAAIGRSLAEPDMADTARAIMQKADDTGCTIFLPQDVVVAAALEHGVATQVVAADACPDDAMILDTGPDSIAAMAAVFEAAATVIWNGPLGAFETPPFDAATVAAARKVAALTRDGALVSVAGGGDTVSALNAAGAGKDFSYVSTAGGAFLEWMEGKTLPGVAALRA